MGAPQTIFRREVEFHFEREPGSPLVDVASNLQPEATTMGMSNFSAIYYAMAPIVRAWEAENAERVTPACQLCDRRPILVPQR